MQRCETALARLALIGGLAFTQAAFADSATPFPSELLGTWSQDCGDLSAAKMIVQPEMITVLRQDDQLLYRGVEISRTWFGGVRASGDRVWILTSKERGQPFEFIIAQENGLLVMEEGHPDYGQEVKSLFGKRFHLCDRERQ